MAGMLVFVTASSENHYRESIPAISSIQHYFPNHTTIYYDLGLSEKQAIEVGNIVHIVFINILFIVFVFNFLRLTIRHIDRVG